MIIVQLQHAGYPCGDICRRLEYDDYILCQLPQPLTDELIECGDTTTRCTSESHLALNVQTPRYFS